MPRLRDRPALLGVLAVTAAGLLARLWTLGARTAHPVEARTAVSILDVQAVGRYAYAPAFEGPFLYHLYQPVFSALGAGDAAMRLGVALVGAALPLTAWLFRERLRDEAVVATAALLAATPVVLYYSRFLGNDVPLATFGLATVGLVVRAVDTGRHGYLYAAAVTFAAATATTWYVLLYVVAWVGALALLADYRVVVDAAAEGSGLNALVDRLRAWAAGAAYWGPPAGMALGVFVVTSVLLFAPRPALYDAVASPAALLDVLDAGSVEAWGSMWDHWIAGSPTTDHDFLDYALAFADALVTGAAAVVVAGVAGFLLDRYRSGGQRAVVAFATYWGAAGLLLYPALAAEPAAWNAVHVAVPLAVPGGVALGWLYRRARRARASGHTGRAVLATLVVLLLGAQVAVAAYGTTYADAQESALAGPEQSPDDLAAALRPVADAAATTDGPHVALFGPGLATVGEHRPLDWYVRAAGATAVTPVTTGDLPDPAPPVVIATTTADGGGDAAVVAPSLRGFDRRGPYVLRPGPDATRIVVFVATDR